MNHTEPVVGRHRPDLDDSKWTQAQAGEWFFTDEDLVSCMCPCGCGSLFQLRLTRDEAKGHRWAWTGDVEQLTLAPSIRRMNGCRWHGHVVGGTWKPEGDSGR
jgi:hypothetical protein